MHLPGSNSEVEFRCLSFEELDIHTLYAVLKLRQEVFCVEQDCAYQDLDDKDQLACHILGFKGGQLIATTRLLMPGESYPQACSIGRVVTSADVRGKGLGQALMRYSIEQAELRFPNHPIQISAQQYLTKFYQSFGFAQQGEGYLEDGIPHIGMHRAAMTSQK